MYRCQQCGRGAEDDLRFTDRDGQEYWFDSMSCLLAWVILQITKGAK